jgi:pimeloyl-ACP methyl ester carboxylesterase
MLTTLPLLLALAGPAPAASPAPSSSSLATAAPRVAKDTIEPALVRTSDKLDLRGDYYPPRGDEGRAPAVLLIHEPGKERGSLVDLAEDLQRERFGVLVLDLRGHGESVHEDYEWATADEAARESLWAFATRDVEAGARWLASRPELHSSNLTVIGVGDGGTLAARHALRDENVRGLGLIGFRTEALGFDMAEDLRDLEGLPVLIAPAKEQRDAAEKVVENLEAADWIRVEPLRATADELLDDKRLSRSMVGFVEEVAVPRRGAGR